MATFHFGLIPSSQKPEALELMREESNQEGGTSGVRVLIQQFSR